MYAITFPVDGTAGARTIKMASQRSGSVSRSQRVGGAVLRDGTHRGVHTFTFTAFGLVEAGMPCIVSFYIIFVVADFIWPTKL